MEGAFLAIIKGLKRKYPNERGKYFGALVALYNLCFEEPFAFDGGAKSGNFNHAGRPGQVGGSAPAKAASAGLNNVLTEEEAQALLFSDWKKTISQAIEKLPKAKNGRAYLKNKDIAVDVPKDFIEETKKEILAKSRTKNEKIAALWAISNIESLFSKSVLTESGPDKHNRPGVKNILRFEIAFPLKIGKDPITAFNTKFTVREFEDGRKVLSPEILDINKGLDLGLYAMSTKK